MLSQPDEQALALFQRALNLSVAAMPYRQVGKNLVSHLRCRIDSR